MRLYITALLLALTLSTALLLTFIVVSEVQPVYKVGDYFIYNVTMNIRSLNATCTIQYMYRVDVIKVEYPRVIYNYTIIDYKTTGECPPSMIPPFNGTQMARIDLRPKIGSSDVIFVDPSYSDIYEESISTGYGELNVSLKYYKGVLTNGKLTQSYIPADVEIRVSVELRDTSVQELIRPPILLYVAIGTVVVLGVAIGVLIYHLRRISKAQSTALSRSAL